LIWRRPLRRRTGQENTMGVAHIAKIIPKIREVMLQPAERCATLEVAGDPARWIQFTDGAVNAAYPHAADPAAMLARLGNAKLEEWQPNKFMTVRLSVTDPVEIAWWIDQYCETVLVGGEAYALNIKVRLL
jgi:hypothetical protein